MKCHGCKCSSSWDISRDENVSSFQLQSHSPILQLPQTLGDRIIGTGPNLAKTPQMEKKRSKMWGCSPISKQLLAGCYLTFKTNPHSSWQRNLSRTSVLSGDQACDLPAPLPSPQDMSFSFFPLPPIRCQVLMGYRYKKGSVRSCHMNERHTVTRAAFSPPEIEKAIICGLSSFLGCIYRQ